MLNALVKSRSTLFQARELLSTSLLAATVSLLATGCGQSGLNNTSTSDGPAAVTPELKPLSHNVRQCPSSIVGNWITFNAEGLPTRKAFNFSGETLIEKTSDQYTYDGVIHEMAPQNGMRFWYVGACQNQKLEFQMWTSRDNQKAFSFAVKAHIKRGRLVERVFVDGDSVEAVTVYSRARGRN